MKKNLRKDFLDQGFALIATISVMSLVVLVALAMLSLASVVTRTSGHGYHLEVARANARVALSQAIAALQSTMGKDQMVCANASILENGITAADYVKNRNWLGVWKTTYTDSGKEWPLVGKKPDMGDPAGNVSPYAYKGIYSDLRYKKSLTNWKESLRQRWLVSGDSASKGLSYTTALDTSVPPSAANYGVEMVGRGTLGQNLTNAEFIAQQVIVPGVVVKDSAGEVNGAFAYWITNNNTRAKITQSPDTTIAEVATEINLAANPAAIKEESGKLLLESFVAKNKAHFSKVITNETLHLLPKLGVDKDVIKEKYFDVTSFAYGLHTNVQKGGFKKDLTPLLLGDKSNSTIVFDLPYGLTDQSNHPFKTDYPMIPGERKAVVGPSFDALRHWGLKSYMSGLAAGSIAAETSFASGATKLRGDSYWARAASDGYGADMSKWASGAPKVNPIMTAATWHVGFSSTSQDGGNFRFHIMPKVEIWNPYNVKMTMPKMAVIMPNFFRHYGAAGNPSSNDNYRIQFFVNSAHATNLKATSLSSQVQSWPLTSGTSDNNNFSDNDNADYYSFYANAKNSAGNAPWAPRNKFIGFVMEGVTFEPGQCLVFSPKVGAAGGDIKPFSETNIENNLLSATVQFGEDSFYMQPSLGDGMEVRLQKTNGPLLSQTDAKTFINSIDFSDVYRFRLNTNVHVTPHASLKASTSGSFATSADAIADSASYPTIQLVNCGSGGTKSGEFWQRYVFNDDRPYQPIVDSDTSPESVDFPRRFQSGVKLSWLDESYFDGNDQESYRFHPKFGHESGAIPFNYPVFAHGSVRPQIVTRAPHHYSRFNYNSFLAGNWFKSYASVTATPADSAELPAFTGGKATKNPFGPASQHDATGRAVMFGLPSPNYGCLSIGSLRHANISPFSWHPTYIIGESYAELAAPADKTAHAFLQDTFDNSSISSGETNSVTNSFDYYNGGSRSITAGNKNSSKRWWSQWSSVTSNIMWGPSTGSSSGRYGTTTNDSILHIGDEAVSKTIDGTSVDSDDPILVYDTSFEVNHHLFDDFFLSGMPINSSNNVAFDWSFGETLHNKFYTWNSSASLDANEINTRLQDATGVAAKPAGLAFGFWNNGYLLANEAQFNVNSTSVDAWVSILSGMRDHVRDTVKGSAGGMGKLIISRVRKPYDADVTANQDPANADAFAGARILTDAEMRNLAENIVLQVKNRGPFLSMSDFVNRRLGDPGTIGSKSTPSYTPDYKTYAGDDDPTTRMGALEAAILKSGINSILESNSLATATAYETANKDSTATEFAVTTEDNRGYSVHTDWQPDYTNRQVHTKIWGAPSYLTQGDVLTPIAPKLSVRGDTFTIRVCGQSIEDGVVMATAYLEAVVVRSSEYVNAAPINVADATLPSGSNRSTTPAIKVNQRTGALIFNTLSSTNQKYGRKFKIIFIKWMTENEI